MPNTISPSGPQLAVPLCARASDAKRMEAPPPRGVFRSSRFTLNPIHSPSGEKKTDIAPSVLASFRGWKSPIPLRYTAWASSEGPRPMNANVWPSGENASGSPPKDAMIRTFSGASNK